MKNAQGNYVNDWVLNLKSMLENLGFAYMLDVNEISLMQLNIIIQRTYDNYIQFWFSEIDTPSKLLSYKLFKETFKSEKYLNCIDNAKFRDALSMFCP